MANVRVERVMCEDISAGENCPTPFAPRIFISMFVGHASGWVGLGQQIVWSRLLFQ